MSKRIDAATLERVTLALVVTPCSCEAEARGTSGHEIGCAIVLAYDRALARRVLGEANQRIPPMEGRR